jgi:cytochrome b561
VQNLAAAPDIAANTEPPPFRYDRKTITLHWSTAILVALLWIIGQLIDDVPAGPLRVDMRSVHILLGLALVVILAMRITWRSRGVGALRPARSGLMDEAAHLGQMLLYVMAVAAVLAGIANLWVRGDSIFNLFSVPSVAPGDKELRKLVGTIHAYATNALVIVALGHSALALLHRYVLRDDVLARMLPAPKREERALANRDST